MATVWMAEVSEFEYRYEQNLSPRSRKRLWGALKTPIQWIPGAITPGIKRLEHEAEHSPPTSVEVKKKRGSMHPLPYTSLWRSAYLV
jgi:hypothetical protein